MTKRQKTVITIIIIAAAVLATAVPVLAYYYREANRHNVGLVPGTVDCELQEVFEDNQKTSITVKNTGTISAYVRVKLVSYWVDADGNIIGSKISEIPAFTLAAGWTDRGNNVYVFDATLPSGAVSTNMLAAPMVLAVDADGNRQVVEVFAEAIQSEGGAAADAWN